MKLIDQTILHVPGVSKGNCQQAAVATILGLSIDNVPNFNNFDNTLGFWGSYHKFLKDQGYVDVELPPTRIPDCYYLGYGKTIRGTRHACIFRKGILIHDPHPSKSGLIDIEEIHLIVPICISKTES